MATGFQRRIQGFKQDGCLEIGGLHKQLQNHKMQMDTTKQD